MSILNSENKRTAKAGKNILASAILKGIDMLSYFLLVPLLLGYLNPYEYGIWLTISSILAWIDSLDIGLGNGMRNRVAEALAKDDRKSARIYVSTTFFALAFIMGATIAFGTVISPFVDWYSLIGVSSESVANLDKIIYFAFCLFCLNMIFKCIGSFFMALQMPAANSFLITTGHVLALAAIYLLTLFSKGNLMAVAIIYSLAPLAVYLAAYPITFKRLYRNLSPAISCFRKSCLKDLLSLGAKFFLLQISGILLFSFVNILISRQFGPEQVTPYNIAYRYFSIILVAMTIILTPLWTACTDAYTRGDIRWIRKTMKKICLIVLANIVLLSIMVIASGFIYRLWINDMVQIPLSLSSLMALYIAILIASLSYSNFLNGLGKLKLQAINTVAMALLFYPFCRFMSGLGGINGILIGMCLLNIPGLILNIIQYHKIIDNRAAGIWNK